MNPQTPRDWLFARHQSATLRLDAARRAALANLTTESPETVPAISALTRLFRSSPTLAGLGAVAAFAAVSGVVFLAMDAPGEAASPNSSQPSATIVSAVAPANPAQVNESLTRLVTPPAPTPSDVVRNSYSGTLGEAQVIAELIEERARARERLQQAETYFNAGLSQTKEGRLTEAAENLQEALRLNPDDPEARDLIGQIRATIAARDRREIAQLNTELKQLRESQQASPNNGALDWQASKIYADLDKIPEAFEAAKAAATKGVDTRTGGVWITAAYYAYTLERYDEALDAINKAAEHPDVRDSPAQEAKRNQVKRAIEAQIASRAKAVP